MRSYAESFILIGPVLPGRNRKKGAHRDRQNKSARPGQAVWFQQRPHITLIDGPGNSPDLNPIENAWNWMKNQLQEKKVTSTSIPQLQAKIRNLWVTKMDDSEYLRGLVESMPRRLQAVLENGGNATKY